MSGSSPMPWIAGLPIIGIAVYAVLRKVDVRLVLLPAGLALGALAGAESFLKVVQTFFAALTDARAIVPICSAMGFAYVLKHTGCDQHLVRLLSGPLRRGSALLVPGTVLVGFLVNVPILSQTGAAVAVGTVMLPILAAARVAPATAGAALLLGCSVGGELLNQGAPEYATVLAEAKRLGVSGLSAAQCVRSTLPLGLVQLGVATLVFWALSVRAEGGLPPGPEPPDAEAVVKAREAEPRVHLLKAAVPLLPLVLLVLSARPIELIRVPPGALVDVAKEAGDLTDPSARARKVDELFQSRLIGAAMVAGAIASALTTLLERKDRPLFLGAARAFCDGAGYAYQAVISVVVAAVCFGAGVRAIGLGQPVGAAIAAWPALLPPMAGLLTLAFGFVCGSGNAATQALFWIFAGAAPADGPALAHVGSMTSLGAAAGRTLSPASAVTLMCAQLTETSPTDLMKRVAVPLLAGLSAAILLGMLAHPSRS